MSSGTGRQVSNFNIANVLTTLRIVMVPFFAWALLHDGGDSPTWRWIAFGLFAVAMITDKIDGDLARKHYLVTDFGKIADPIADKALIGASLIGLSLLDEVGLVAADGLADEEPEDEAILDEFRDFLDEIKPEDF